MHTRSAALLLSLGLAFAGPARAVNTSIPRGNQPLTGPQAALEQLAQAYRELSLPGIEAVLTADCRFHTAGDSLMTFTAGLPREAGLRAVRELLEGVTRDGRVVTARADSVGVATDGISAGVDPEHPDSTQHYQVLTVTRAQWSVRTVSGSRVPGRPGAHVFHVVRGDVAVRAPGQAADSAHWYIRRWLQDVSGVRRALGTRKGDCPDSSASVRGTLPGSPGAGGTLALRALAQPACPALRVRCDVPAAVPAWLEVYDVSGRRMNRRALAATSPGTLTVDVGAGVRLLPGVYWVRLAQAGNRPDTRMVLVGR